MVAEATFPILWPHRREEIAVLRAAGCPASVPLSVLATHERQALSNHSQTLDELARRGGLAPCEMAAVLEDRPWRRMDQREAVVVILRACGPKSPKLSREPRRAFGGDVGSDIADPCECGGKLWCASCQQWAWPEQCRSCFASEAR